MALHILVDLMIGPNSLAVPLAPSSKREVRFPALTLSSAMWIVLTTEVLASMIQMETWSVLV